MKVTLRIIIGWVLIIRKGRKKNQTHLCIFSLLDILSLHGKMYKFSGNGVRICIRICTFITQKIQLNLCDSYLSFQPKFLRAKF